MRAHGSIVCIFQLRNRFVYPALREFLVPSSSGYQSLFCGSIRLKFDALTPLTDVEHPPDLKLPCAGTETLLSHEPQLSSHSRELVEREVKPTKQRIARTNSRNKAEAMLDTVAVNSFSIPGSIRLCSSKSVGFERSA